MDARTTTPNGALNTFTIPAAAPRTVLTLGIMFDFDTGLWYIAVPASDEHGLTGWKIGWYREEGGVPTTLVATTWMAL